jgi:hypothetical protein
MYFNMGFGDLTIWDWKEIRTGNYWEIRDSLSGFDREMFIHGRIELWRKNKLNKS